MTVRCFPLLLAVFCLCCAGVANAQNYWRNSQPPLIAQTPGNTNSSTYGNVVSNSRPQGLSADIRPASPMFPSRSDYDNSSNYDLPSNPVDSVKITRQTQFAIPFEISKQNQQRFDSIELIYSMDRGHTWYSYESVTVDKNKFDFNAPEDGEYWFAFRAATKSEGIQQLGSVPKARIIVDTRPPQLTLEARRNASGEVNIEWSAEDTALKNALADISLSYDSNITWEKLAVNPKNISRNGNRETGRVTFWPRHSADAVDIRCELEDAAGNKEIQTTRLKLKQVADDPMGSAMASTAADVDTAAFPAIDRSALHATPTTSVLPPRPVVSQKPTSQETHAVSAAASSEAISDTIPTAITPDAETIEGTETVAPVQNFTAETKALSENADTQLLDLLRDMGGAPPSAVSADVTRHYADNNGLPLQRNAASPTSSNLPGVLSDIPAARFMPANNGTSGQTHLPQLPMSEQTTLQDKANTANKLSDQQNGDEETFPGKISLVSLGKFGEQDCMIVRWLPGDAAMADGKIDLYRSSTRHGPWRAIAFDLQNTGEHYWLVSAEDQMPFYLRIDLRSRVGLFTDFTTHTIATPLSFGTSTPPSDTRSNVTNANENTANATLTTESFHIENAVENTIGNADHRAAQ